MDVTDVVLKGNNFAAKFTFRKNCSSNLSVISESPKYLLNSAVVFQVRAVYLQYWDEKSDGKIQAIHLYTRFLKRHPDDTFQYKLLLSSVELGFTNYKLSNDDGTWALVKVLEAKEHELVLSARVEVMSHNNWFSNLHDDSVLADFELRGVDGGVRVHRAALAGASPVLRRMMEGGWREAAQGHVDISDTTAATLRHFKEYIYLDNLPDTGLEQLMLLASCYMMPRLEQQCVDRLVSTLCAENATNMVEFALQHKLSRLLFSVFGCMKSGALELDATRTHYEKSEITDN